MINLNINNKLIHRLKDDKPISSCANIRVFEHPQELGNYHLSITKNINRKLINARLWCVGSDELLLKMSSLTNMDDDSFELLVKLLITTDSDTNIDGLEPESLSY